MGTARHIQASARVNAMVDIGIKELVEALSRFEDLRTIESCQDIGDGVAWVCFQYGSTCEDLGTFVISHLGPAIMEAVGDGAGVSVRVGTNLKAVAEITVRAGAMLKTIETVNHLRLV